MATEEEEIELDIVEKTKYYDIELQVVKLLSKLRNSDFNDTKFDDSLVELHFELVETTKTASAKLKESISNLMVDSELLSIIDSKLDNVQKSGAYREANIYYMLLLLSQILANGSGKMADSVFELSLHRTLLKALFEIYHLNLNSENDKKRRVRILVACCYNSMKVSPATIIEFRKGGLVEVCNHYAENTSKYWNSEEELVFLFALSYAADFDANPEALRTAQINLYYLYYCGLQQALERDDHKSSEGGYALAEILTSVSRLALHNSNASFFIEHRIVKTCQIIIEAKFSQDEVKQALEILWTLSFQKKGCTEIKENTDLMAVIMSYEKDGDAKIAQAANGISFQLNVDQETSKVAAQDKQTQGTSVAQQDEEPKHIMISYSWQQAEVFYDYLKKFIF